MLKDVLVVVERYKAAYVDKIISENLIFGGFEVDVHLSLLRGRCVVGHHQFICVDFTELPCVATPTSSDKQGVLRQDANHAVTGCECPKSNRVETLISL